MNKTLLTVGQVFAIVSGIFLLFGIFSIPFAILNFVAVAKITAVKEGKADKETLKGWGIYLIFTSVAGGICTLLGIYIEDNNFKSDMTMEQKLKETESLYDRGIINREEYEERRRQILERL